MKSQFSPFDALIYFMQIRLLLGLVPTLYNHDWSLSLVSFWVILYKKSVLTYKTGMTWQLDTECFVSRFRPKKQFPILKYFAWISTNLNMINKMRWAPNAAEDTSPSSHIDLSSSFVAAAIMCRYCASELILLLYILHATLKFAEYIEIEKVLAVFNNRWTQHAGSDWRLLLLADGLS